MLRIFNTGYIALFIFFAGLSVAIAAESEFTGSVSCSSCHAEQQRSWQGSDHDLAMQHTREDTVLGDFNNTEFSANGITSRFFKKDGKFWVNTDGPDGNMQDFEIKYTFGVTPLQQYLIEFPGGRIQTLGIAWDTRPASIYILTRPSMPAMSCTGQAPSKTGITCVRAATRPTWSKATTARQTPSKQPGQISM